MTLTRYKSYTNSLSDLKFVVHNIYYVGETYIKCKGSLVNKRNGIVYETKSFRLDKKLIQDWREIED